MKKRNKKKSLAVESYSEKNYWSLDNKLWKKYEVKKPRLPSDDLDKDRWNEKLYPSGFHGFIGSHNDEIVTCMKDVCEELANEGKFPNVLIVSGPDGSGKSSISNAFGKYICDTIGVDIQKMKRVVLTVNALTEGSALWQRVASFSRLKDDVIPKNVPVTFRFIFVDNMQTVTPSEQQEVKKLMGEFVGKLKWVFITNDPSSLIGYIRSQAILLKTRIISEKDALYLLLSILFRFKIGYDRVGVQDLFLNNQKVSKPCTI